jgi:hypothetical protein
VAADYGELIRDGLAGRRFQLALGSAGLLRPDLSLPAYAGKRSRDGVLPIFNLFDRTNGGRNFTHRVSRTRARDFRGGKLTYDEHDGTDFVTPVGTLLVAAASGTVVMIRDRWLRGGLTLALDHGGGVVTQYTHLARVLVELGQPVPRGVPIAQSGAAGVDMAQFFPWVPPHLHFMSWVRGVPVDPFVSPGESSHPGAWRDGAPRVAPAGAAELVPPPSAVDEAALFEAIGACTHAGIRAELERALGQGLPMAAALAEDALHHDQWAWPREFWRRPVRPRHGDTGVRLSLPFSGDEVRGVRFADSRFTRPPAGEPASAEVA